MCILNRSFTELTIPIDISLDNFKHAFAFEVDRFDVLLSIPMRNCENLLRHDRATCDDLQKFVTNLSQETTRASGSFGIAVGMSDEFKYVSRKRKPKKKKIVTLESLRPEFADVRMNFRNSPFWEKA